LARGNEIVLKKAISKQREDKKAGMAEEAKKKAEA